MGNSPRPLRHSLLAFATLLSFALVAAINPGGHTNANSRAADADNAVQAQMRNVTYRFTDSAAVHINSLDGEVVPIKPADYPVFDKKNSFHIRIASAEISIAAADLASIFNSYVFARPNTPLSDLSVSIEKGRVKIKGRLHKAGEVPFETEGLLTPTSDGKILLHAAKVKALHVPVKGIMNLFGVEIADLIKSGKIPGVESREDDLILDPALVFPPPHMEGKVTAIRIEGDRLVIAFGDKSHAAKNLQSGNYMSYRGNRLAFGKLTMTDADMTLIDMDASDPFDFYLDRYQAQLSAGYTKITPTFGLRVYMKDLNKLPRSASQKKSPAKTD
jgi:hypothetical protein